MEKELDLGIRTLNERWKQLFESLEKANEAFNEFVSGNLSVSDTQRIKTFVRKWDTLKEQCESFYDEIDRRVNASMEPVDIELPWKSEEFKAAWQYWKEYLREQHHVYVRSRAEKKMLARLKKIADGDEQKAIEYLDYAESVGLNAGKSDSEKEDLYFNAAEQIFQTEDYGKALASLQNYLQRYPEGRKADCIRETGLSKPTVYKYWD
jgi:TolA-binding protein